MRTFLFAGLFFIANASGGVAQDGLFSPEPLRQEQLGCLKWRSVGPANMEGRVVALAFDPKRSATFYVAAATGGVWKTKNAGTTFEPIFENGSAASIGDVAVAPSNGDIVWVGTGEANARNSVSPGDGVSKSIDAGKTWTAMGLNATQHIGRIAIHPSDPEIVFVAAVGHVFGPNPERGLYKTNDGGKTWSLVLYLDEDTGCVDVAIDPQDPRFVYAAAYAVRRDAFDGNDPAVKTGVKAGIYKSEDCGISWRRLENGLPTVKLGRIGFDVWKKDPSVIFAVVETALTGKAPPIPGVVDSETAGPAYLGVQAEDADENGVKILELVSDAAAEKAGVLVDDVLLKIGTLSLDGYEAMTAALREHKAGESSLLQVRRGKDVLDLDVTFSARPPERAAGTLGGQLENRQRQQGKTGFETGGVFKSADRGETWERVNSVNPRPFYYSQIRIDPTDAERIWVMGTSLYVTTDGGKTFRSDGAPRVHVDHHALLIDPEDPRHLILGNDGGLSISWDRGKNWEDPGILPVAQYYAVAVDDRNPYRMYGGLQDNGTWSVPSRTRFSSGITNDVVFKIGEGDGFVCAVDPADNDTVYSESQNGNIQRVDLKTGERSAIRRPRAVEGRPATRYRFNWKTPFILSPHNPRTLYFGAQRVLRSVNRGGTSFEISPDLTVSATGTLSTLAESPREEGVLWAGSDDGALQVTRDGGRTWEAVHANLPDVPGPRWVSHVEASRSAGGTAYVVLDGHRSDDSAAYVFKTTDYGATFARLGKELPAVTTRVLREDPKRLDVLYLGTEVGVFVSVDGGTSFLPLKNGLPTVPVHDLAIQAREKELIAATHGRGLWILDISPLQTLDGDARDAELMLFTPRPAVLWARLPGPSRSGKRQFSMPNPEGGAEFYYWLGKELADDTKVKVTVKDIVGKVIKDLDGGKKVGLNRIHWDLSRERERGREGDRSRERGRLEPGTYAVEIKAGEQASVAVLTVIADPGIQTGGGER